MSLVIGKIAGVKIRLNLLLLLLGLLYASLGLVREILLVFSAVLLHELAHLLTAYLLNIHIKEIELWPFGGQAQLEDYLALEPEKEILLALSGPLFSLSLAGASYYFAGFFSEPWRTMSFHTNLILAGFNSLPALPLDGGHICQAWLASRIGYRKANRLMSSTGQILGLGMTAAGIYWTLKGGPGVNLVLVGLFLVWAAYRERRFLGFAFMRFLVRKKKELSQAGFLPARQLVGTPVTPIKQLLQTVGPSTYLIVSVVDEQYRIIDFRGEAELIELLLEKGPDARLGDHLI